MLPAIAVTVAQLHLAVEASHSKRRRVHIFEEGKDVATDEDSPGRFGSKHLFGRASHGALVRLAGEVGADEPEVDLFTSPDLLDCHLFGNDEERRFLGGVFGRIGIPEAEFAISRNDLDETTRDIEVNAVRSLPLAGGARIRHSRVVAENEEKLSSALEHEKKNVEESEVLRKKVEGLESKIAKDKKVVEESYGAMNRIIELRSEVDTKKADIEKLEKSRDEAVALAECRALEMERLRSALLDCMREAKALVDTVFAKGGMEPSEALPKADPKLFADWLSLELGNFQDLLNGSLDVGAYGAAIGLAGALRQLGCGHLRAIGRPSHNFPDIGTVRAAIQDRACVNVASRVITRYWVEGGRDLTVSIGGARTQEVSCYCIAWLASIGEFA